MDVNDIHLNSKSHEHRYKNRNHIHLKLTVSDFYDERFGLTPKQWREFFKFFFIRLSEEIIRKQYYWNLPGKGIVRIKKGKTGLKKKKIDWHESLKFKAEGGEGYIYHKNLATNGYYFGWYWQRPTGKDKKEMQYYTFNSLKCNNPGQTCGKKGLKDWIRHTESSANMLKEYDCAM